MFDRDITIDPVDRLSRAKPKRKRRAGAYLFICSFLSLTILSGCDNLDPAFTTPLIEQHFTINQEAFKALEVELLNDPDVQEVSSCPRESDECFYFEFEPVTEQQIAREKKYQPLLRALGFRNHVFFTRHDQGFFVFPNMGHASKGAYGLNASLRLDPTQERKLPKCDGYVPVGYLYDCYTALDENWAIHWRGFNDEMTNTCSAQAAYDACDPETRENHDWSCFKQCTDKLDAEALAEQSLSQAN